MNASFCQNRLASPSYTLLIALMLVLIFRGSPVLGNQCSGSTHEELTFAKPVQQFSPTQKIYVRIGCTLLQPGDYTAHVNWIHKQRGIIRSDKRGFTLGKAADHTLYFWIKLSPKGPLASVLTGQEFHEENLGEWLVEGYLNDELVITKEFTIEQ